MSWFKTWPLLSYEQNSDKVYCHICQKAIKSGIRKGVAFVSSNIRVIVIQYSKEQSSSVVAYFLGLLFHYRTSNRKTIY